MTLGDIAEDREQWKELVLVSAICIAFLLCKFVAHINNIIVYQYLKAAG